nr:transcriptional regulator GutM [Helcobacillus sp. ACRRO]
MMLLGAVLSTLQARRYNAALRTAIAESRNATDVLVSGKNRSFTGGAIVVLVIDPTAEEVVWARAMTGRTVFSRFRRQPTLLGPVSTVVDRARSRHLKAAVEHALQQIPTPKQPSRSKRQRAAVRPQRRNLANT